MLKKSMIVLTIVLVLTIAVSAFMQASFAWGGDWNTVESTLDSADGDAGGADADVARMADAILSVVQVVGMAVAVIMLVVLAIKYISAAPSDKAEIKKHAVVYVVGAVLLFAASGILQIVKAFAGNIGHS